MKRAHTLSWILFTLLGVMFLIPSLLSVNAAYFNPEADLIAGQYTPAELAGGDEMIANALSARRGTAAAFGVSYGVLVLAIALFPYRRKRAQWAFLALVLASLLNAGIVLLRFPLLQTGFGAVAAFAPLAAVAAAVFFWMMGSDPRDRGRSA